MPEPAPPPAHLYALFAATAAAYPDQVAVEVPPGPERPRRDVITYAALQQRAEALSAVLGGWAQPDTLVVILLPRASVDLYAAQLAVLRAGAAFTCLDPRFPDGHLAAVMEDARPVAVITDRHGRARMGTDGHGREWAADRVGDVPVVLLEDGGTDDRQHTLGDGGATRWPLPEPSHLAYVIYTSGTTGRPKGVMIEQRGIVNLVSSNVAEFGLGPGDRVAQCSSPAYDSSLEETWLAWAVGATLVVLDDETTRLGPDLVPWLVDEGITVLCPPPTLLRATGCLDPAAALPQLRLLYVGGEALPPDLADRWARGRRMVNGYGPTECTVTVTRGPVRVGEPVTIGQPVPGNRAWLLGEDLMEVPPGEPGELCIGGVGLARGYLGQPALTAERFPLHPRLGRIYRTGDLVRQDAQGDLHYLGRLDGQVKLRGYRVELGAVEAHLATLPGVRGAACRVQGDAASAVLAAHIVAEDPDEPPVPATVQTALRAVLPAYMVPSRIGFLSALPTTVGGKLDRAALPELPPPVSAMDEPRDPPRDALEQHIAAAFAAALGLDGPVSIHDDFFVDLGGDSLSAVGVVTALRRSPDTAAVAVRDVYDARTVAALADRLRAERPATHHTDDTSAAVSTTSVLLCTLAQGSWLMLLVSLFGLFAYAVAFVAAPWLVNAAGLTGALLLAPLLGLGLTLLYAPLSVLLAVVVKRLLIGRYVEARLPVWSGAYLRHWLVAETARLIPWSLVEGTLFHHVILRALGAHIGARVHIHRGVDLRRGGWDLLTLGDDVTLGQDAALRLTDWVAGNLVVGPVTLGNGVTLETRAAVSPGGVVEDGGYLTALSWLPGGGRIPAGECWDGVPASPAGDAPSAPEVDSGEQWSERRYAALLVLARCGQLVAVALLWVLVALAVTRLAPTLAEQLLAWLLDPGGGWAEVAWLIVVPSLAIPLTLLGQALMMRATGPVATGTVSAWSPAALRIWLKTGTVDAASRWLSGSLFWPPWLRLAGMRIGPGCEISTIIDVLPETVTIGAESFFADGIYFCAPQRHRGTIAVAPTMLGRNTFLGNHAVVPAGQVYPDDLFVGVSTVADAGAAEPASSWFGHPPLSLPRRAVAVMDRRLTHDPDTLRYVTRLFWELARLALPILPLCVWLGWYAAVDWAAARFSPVLLLAVVIPLLTLLALGLPCLATIALKWLLLGRVRAGQHPFWSCWCGRWDFLYVAWNQWAQGPLAWLEGSLCLNAVLRLTGMHIGRRVVLGEGFSQVVDPDMLHFEDHATVACQFQAHTFEDRVLKIGPLHIREGATVGANTVVFYGADIGPGVVVAPDSVVMKHEVLPGGGHFAGCPTRGVGGRRARDISPG